MAILDFGASEAGGWWDTVPPSERPELPAYVRRRSAVPRRAVHRDANVGIHSTPDLIGWTLRIATVVAVVIATILGLVIALDAPTISPVAVVGQGPQPDGQS